MTRMIEQMAKVVHMERYRIHLLDADFTLKDNALVRRISGKNMCVAVLDHPEQSLHDYGIPRYITYQHHFKLVSLPPIVTLEANQYQSNIMQLRCIVPPIYTLNHWR
jgi:hypothetical protein